MNTDLTDKKTLLYREKLARSLQDLSSFQRFNKALFQKLFDKGLNIKKSDGIYFFDNVFEIFAILTEKSVKEAGKIRTQICETIRNVKDWSQIDNDFAFINKNPEIRASFLENIDNPIFTGFLLLFMCKWHKYNLKIYQLQEGNSLISCEIGSETQIECIRLAILVSPYGPRFALLDKSGEKCTFEQISNIPKSLSEFSPVKVLANERGSFETYLESITNFEIFSNQVKKEAKKELDKNDLRMLKTIVDNVGICPQFFIDYSEYLRYKEFIQMAKKELGFLFHNIVKSVAQKSCQNIEFITTKESVIDHNQKKYINAPANITSFANFTNVLENCNNVKISVNQPQSNKASSNVLNEPPIVPSMANLAAFEILAADDNYRRNIRFGAPDGDVSMNNLYSYPQGEGSNRNEQSRLQLIYSNASLAQSHDPSPMVNKQGNQGVFQSVLSFGNTMKEISTNNLNPSPSESASRKPVIIEQNNENRFGGTLKFYNEPKKFGFLVKDDDGSDVFFHLSDMELGGITESMLLTRKDLKFSFVTMKYVGKKAESKKAVEIKLLY
jgi:cold shock CspA family protein